MARDEKFKKYQEAGADFLETARARAEEFLKELAKATDSTQKQGRGTIDDLMEGSRRGTEQFISSVRKEVASQLSALGIATKDDLAALERRLTGKPAPAKKAAAKPGTTAKRSATSKSAAKKSSPRKTPAAKKTTRSS